MALLDDVQAFAADLAKGPGAVREHLGTAYFGYTPSEDEPTASEAIGSVVDDLASALPDLRIGLSDPAESEDGVAATLTLDGTHTGPLWGVPGSGDAFHFTCPVTLRAVEGGLGVRLEGVTPPDAIGAFRSLGLANAPDEMHLPPPVNAVVPELFMRVLFTGQMADVECSHLAEVEVTEPSTRVCEQCFAAGDIWPALRMCLYCGFVGCCDTSVNRHAHAHYVETGHPLIRSIRLNEGWMWCYEDNAFFDSRKLRSLQGA